MRIDTEYELVYNYLFGVMQLQWMTGIDDDYQLVHKDIMVTLDQNTQRNYVSTIYS
jgi:hypothetical protein